MSTITENLFELLPNEIMMNFFSFLPIPDLAKASAVCKTWNAIIKDNTYWKFRSLKEMPFFTLQPGKNWKEHYFLNKTYMKFSEIHYSKEYGRNGAAYFYTAGGKWIRIWKRIRPLHVSCHTTETDHSGSITSFALKHLGLITLLLTGSIDKTIKVWKINYRNNQLSLIQTLKGQKAPITALKSASNDMICADQSGSLYWHQLETRTLNYHHQNSVQAHQSCITHLCLNRIDCRTNIYTTSCDHTIKIWSLKDKKFSLQQEVKDNFGPITSLDCHNSEGKIFSAYKDGTIRMWEKNEKSLLEIKKVLPPYFNQINSIHLPTPYILVAASNNEALSTRLKDMDLSPQCTIRLLNENEEILSVKGAINSTRSGITGIFMLTHSNLVMLSLPKGQRKWFNLTVIPIGNPQTEPKEYPCAVCIQKLHLFPDLYNSTK